MGKDINIYTKNSIDYGILATDRPKALMLS